MVGDAHQTTVGDYITLIRGTTYKGALVGEPGPALLGLGSIEPGGGFRIGNYKTYGGDCPKELMLFPGDIYASLKGATKDGKMIGSVARVPPSVPTGRLTQDTVKLVFRDRDPLIETYLYWVLRTPQYREYCAGHAMGSAVVALSRRDFLSYSVPPLTMQRKIVINLLEAIEMKIDLNRCVGETLEMIARALFKSWFVDFDPVHARAECRDSDLPARIAKLFPARLMDSEIGKIPEGWKVDHVNKIADVIYGAPFASSKFNSDGIGVPLIRIRNLENEEPNIWTTEVHPKGYKVRPGDIVVGMDGEFRAYLWAGTHSWLNQRNCVFAPKAGWSAAFVRNAIVTPLADVEATETATTVIHLGKADIDRFKVILPSNQVANAFNRICDPIYERIVVCRQESRTLATVRDSILPKLIAGELCINNAERHLAKADL